MSRLDFEDELNLEDSLTLVEREDVMEQLTRSLAVSRVNDPNLELVRELIIPAGSRLAPLTLQSSDSLLSPLGSHLRSNSTRVC